MRFQQFNLISPELVLTDEEIRNTRINEAFLEMVYADDKSLISFFAQYRLFSNFSFCNNCDLLPMTVKKRIEYIDKYCWFCNRCKKSVSLRVNSFFANSRLSGKLILKTMYKYLNNVEFVQIAYDLNISRKTVSDYCDLFREAICFYLQLNNSRIGGVDEDGNASIVEIDESLFFRRKYNRGRIQNEQWYVGGIQRGTRRCFIVPVENRNAITMTSIIIENVLPGTKIITDKWRAYECALRNMNEYDHATINHSLHFVDPLDPSIYTQNVKGLWSRSKYYLREKKGISLEKQSFYLIQFLWEYNTDRYARMNELIILLKYED